MSIEPWETPQTLSPGETHALWHRLRASRCYHPWDAMAGSETIRTCPTCKINVYRAEDEGQIADLASTGEDHIPRQLYRRSDGTFTLELGHCAQSMRFVYPMIIFLLAAYIFAFNSPTWIGALLNGTGIAICLLCFKKKSHQVLGLFVSAILATSFLHIGGVVVARIALAIYFVAFSTILLVMKNNRERNRKYIGVPALANNDSPK